MADTKFEAIYACKQHAGYMLRVGTIRYRFEKHQLIITSEEEAEAMDELLSSNTLIGAKIKKVDLAAAEALVADHVASHGGAHSGLFSSSNMSQLEPNKLGGRDASLDLMGDESKAKVVDALAKDSLVVTEKTESAPAIKPAVNILKTAK